MAAIWADRNFHRTAFAPAAEGAGNATQSLRSAIRTALHRMAPDEVETFDLIAEVEPRRQEVTFEPEMGAIDPTLLGDLMIYAKDMWATVQPIVDNSLVQLGGGAVLSEALSDFRAKWTGRIKKIDDPAKRKQEEDKLDAFIEEVKRNAE